MLLHIELVYVEPDAPLRLACQLKHAFHVVQCLAVCCIFAIGNIAAGMLSLQRVCLFRLKSALRRCDVRDPDDFDEAEYREASKSVGEQTYAMVQCTSQGWKFPWGLRVRICEMLLRGVFDPLEEGLYIEGADAYLQMLQTKLWPLLGISPAMHNAGFAWIHFRQFVVTKEESLLAKTKALLRRLSQLTTDTSAEARVPLSNG